MEKVAMIMIHSFIPVKLSKCAYAEQICTRYISEDRIQFSINKEIFKFAKEVVCFLL